MPENSIRLAEFLIFDYAFETLHDKIAFNENELCKKIINGVSLKLSFYSL